MIHGLKQRLLVMTIIMMTLILSISGTQAQSLNEDIITFRNGDLWTIDVINNTATQLTQWGYNGGPILSPDGRRIVYLSTPQELIEQVNNGNAPTFAGSAPANIWMMDIQTQSFTRIADQSGAIDLGYLRSVPSWSPDGTKLVWSQLDATPDNFSFATLQVYDINTGLQATLAQNVSMGFQDGGVSMPQVYWGESGIARILFTYTEESRNPFLFMEIYNATNGNLTRYDLGYDQNAGNYVQDWMWVNHQGRIMIAMRIFDQWQLFDPTNGSRTGLPTPPRLKAKFISGGLELVPVTIPSDTGGYSIQWQAVSGQFEYNTGLVTFGIDTYSMPSISFDGSQIAWHNGDGVSTWSPSLGQTGRISERQQELGQYFLVPPFRNVAWAPTEWVTSTSVITPQPTPTNPPTTNVCNLTPQLIIGRNAVVNPGPSNRVRVGATTNSAIIDSIDDGEVVYVERGPVCANGFNWFFIRNDRIAGWTAEGGNGDYWLSIDIDNSYCFNSPPTRLTNNSIAVVLPGEPNNVRDNPGTAGTNVIDIMAAGETFVTIGSSVCDAEGRRWYPIQYGATLGWTAEGEGDEYWIGPASGSDG